ncbi:hypothetical protein CLV78_102150 [Aliiruegeria haliotis]|uniref:Uncharacterized protein n=1 Tax=Aliiruegeria haliotis TaxID=1280846 RepID=A0A2T0RUU7_9RHOB|nr:hypothetical protein [Aliiruegeria haliotis]PRY24976.1 hypothetical protein CLV78_102150 [Aliiruegeria haliotis]
MDGKVLLVMFAALFGGVYFLGQQEFSLGGGSPTTSRPVGTGMVVDLRHQAIRQTLVREGYDLNDPASFVREVDGREIVGGPVAATEHLRPVFIDEVMEAYADPVASEVPARPVQVAAREDCTFTPPARKARLANIFSNGTLESISLYAFDEIDVTLAARAAQDRRKSAAAAPAASTGGMVAFSGGQTDGGPVPFWQQVQYTVMEVVVTEVEHPVHLVLQAGAGRVLWNIHKVGDARISGVSLLGGEAPGVANLPRSVPVEILDNADLVRCGIDRTRLPLATDPVFTVIDAGTVSEARARAGLEERAARVERWNEWFAGQFGLRSDTTRIGYDEAAIMAVVGPLPTSAEDRVQYHSLKGARVTMGETGYVITRTPMRARQAIDRMVKDQVEVLAQTAKAEME